MVLNTARKYLLQIDPLMYQDIQKFEHHSFYPFRDIPEQNLELKLKK